MHIKQCALNSTQYTLPSAQKENTVYSAQHTVYSAVQFTLQYTQTGHSTKYTIHMKQYAQRFGKYNRATDGNVEFYLLR